MIFAVLSSAPEFNFVSIIFYILSIFGLVGGAWLVLKSRIPQQTIKNLQEVNASYIELNATYEKRISSLELKIKEDANLHIENAKAISDLQGQIKVYKELPLKELADGIAKLNDGQDLMLKAIQDNGAKATASATLAQSDTEQVAKTLRNS